jgi:hypothetical protein
MRRASGVKTAFASCGCSAIAPISTAMIDSIAPHGNAADRRQQPRARRQARAAASALATRPQRFERVFLGAGLHRQRRRGARGIARRHPAAGDRGAEAEQEEESAGPHQRVLHLRSSAGEEPAAEIAAEQRSVSASAIAAPSSRPSALPATPRIDASTTSSDCSSRDVTPVTRRNASCERRAIVACACSENTRKAPVNSATSASTFRLTR